MKYLQDKTTLTAVCVGSALAVSFEVLQLGWGQRIAITVLAIVVAVVGSIVVDHFREDSKLRKFATLTPDGGLVLLLTRGNVKAYRRRLVWTTPDQFERQAGRFADLVVPDGREAERVSITQTVLGGLLAAATHPDLAKSVPVRVCLPPGMPFPKVQLFGVGLLERKTTESTVVVVRPGSPTCWALHFYQLEGQDLWTASLEEVERPEGGAPDF